MAAGGYLRADLLHRGGDWRLALGGFPSAGQGGVQVLFSPDAETLVTDLRGEMRVKFEGGELVVRAGQAVMTKAGEWIQYSTPDEATEYVAVCWPAFSPETVHRDE